MFQTTNQIIFVYDYMIMIRIYIYSIKLQIQATSTADVQYAPCRAGCHPNRSPDPMTAAASPTRNCGSRP